MCCSLNDLKMFDKRFFARYAEGSISSGEYNMATAITEELHLIVQVAGFEPLSGAVKHELVLAIQNTLAIHAAKRNFLVGAVAIDTKAGN
jgi:hypothetical protein